MNDGLFSESGSLSDLHPGVQPVQGAVPEALHLLHLDPRLRAALRLLGVAPGRLAAPPAPHHRTIIVISPVNSVTQVVIKHRFKDPDPSS